MSDLQKKSPNQLNKGNKLKGVFFEDSHFFAPGLIDSLMAVNKGKVIYIDVWATWCGPCISQFKRQGKFKNALKDGRFIYLRLWTIQESRFLESHDG